MAMLNNQMVFLWAIIAHSYVKNAMFQLFFGPPLEDFWR